MKNMFFLLLLISLSPAINSQVSYLQYRTVHSSDEEKFLEYETKFWSQVAKNAIEKDQLMSWTLWRKVGVTESDAPNYLFVNTFKNVTDLDNLHLVWEENIKALDWNASTLSTSLFTKVNFDYIVQREASIGKGSKYIIINYAKPDDFIGFVEENRHLWQGIHKENIASGITGMSSWGLGTVIYPQGNQDRFTCYTWDGFEKLSDAYNYLRYHSNWEMDADSPLAKALEDSNMSEILPNGFEYRIIYERVMTVE